MKKFIIPIYEALLVSVGAMGQSAEQVIHLHIGVK